MQVTPNDEVRGMVATGANMLPNKVVQDAFKGMHGRTLNFVAFKRAIHKLDKWYHDKGILGQVCGGRGSTCKGMIGKGGTTRGMI